MPIFNPFRRFIRSTLFLYHNLVNPQSTQEMDYIERNVTRIAIWTLIIGSSIALGMPFLVPLTGLFGLHAPNEMGDTFSGIANPFLSIIGILLTFLAFYIQYKANDRQTKEIEKQKKESEYKFIQESINAVKEDIRHLTYTRDRVTYHYSEAIWYFMIDHIHKENESELSPLHYQLAYVLTNFEPILAQIKNSNLERPQKYQALSDIDGLFEASMALILLIYEKAVQEGRDRRIRGYLKTRIIIPAKKIKFELRDIIEKHRESEKEQFVQAVSRMKGYGLVKQARVISGQGTVTFYGSYEEYLKNAGGTEIMTESQYEAYFAKDDQITKILMNEPVRILTKLSFLQHITMTIPFKDKTYRVQLGREEVENYFGLDLDELRIDKMLWRDEFVGKFVYSAEERRRFAETFIVQD